MPCNNLHELSTHDLWVVIATKLAHIGGVSIPEDINSWNTQELMRYVSQHIGCLNNVI